MSQAELDALERDVEGARAKFVGDLARLRSPDTISSFKEDLWAEAHQTKDELIEKTTEVAKDGAQKIFNGLKKRAIANPAAALAIGAGLAWRLVHRPPIASLLVGVGLISLLRTSYSQHGGHGNERGIVSHAQDLAGTVREKTQEWGHGVGDVLQQSMTQLADGAASVAKQAASVVQGASTAARETATQIADQAAVMTQHASEVISDQEVRDNLLLGAAALAVTAAISVAYQRRAHALNQH
jgi:vacuolar-type H+-ATPase subunit H